MNRPVLTLCGAIAFCVVGAGLSMYGRRGPSVLERSVLATFGAPVPAAETPSPPTTPLLDEHGAQAPAVAVRANVNPSGARVFPADELAALPSVPRNRPRGENYVVISREWNRLWLMRDDDVLHACVCATGKGDTLVWEKGGKTWVFDTPRGEFTVQHKSSNPRWVPPEWEYVERGEEPPDWLGRNRDADYGMLGDYAINFGDDYNIHGTLYEGLLGRSITHGCVRVGARDLAFIYPRVAKGTKVFVY